MDTLLHMFILISSLAYDSTDTLSYMFSMDILPHLFQWTHSCICLDVTQRTHSCKCSNGHTLTYVPMDTFSYVPNGHTLAYVLMDTLLHMFQWTPSCICSSRHSLAYALVDTLSQMSQWTHTHICFNGHTLVCFD